MSGFTTSVPFEWQDVAFVVSVGVAIAFLIPVQLASMILFDSTGLDASFPDFVFMVLLPGVTTGLIPTITALRLYRRDRVAAIAVASFLGLIALAAYLVQYYGVCSGPTC